MARSVAARLDRLDRWTRQLPTTAPTGRCTRCGGEHAPPLEVLQRHYAGLPTPPMQPACCVCECCAESYARFKAARQRPMLAEMQQTMRGDGCQP
jgi:hypothetical protein